MRNAIGCFCLILVSFSRLYSQEIKLDLSYKYLLSNQWNNIIQVYNFTRPYLSDKQTLLNNGFSSSFSLYFPKKQGFSNGIYFSYSNFRSKANNSDFSNKLSLNLINIGYIAHFENYKKSKGLYSEFIASLSSSMLLRSINEEPFVYDDSQSKALGIGAELNYKIAYRFPIKEKFQISPFFKVGVCPFIFSPNTEVLINQTKELVSKNWTSNFSAQLGIAFHFNKNEGN